jgi:hypothetical protein
MSKEPSSASENEPASTVDTPRLAQSNAFATPHTHRTLFIDITWDNQQSSVRRPVDTGRFRRVTAVEFLIEVLLAMKEFILEERATGAQRIAGLLDGIAVPFQAGAVGVKVSRPFCCAGFCTLDGSTTGCCACAQSTIADSPPMTTANVRISGAVQPNYTSFNAR